MKPLVSIIIINWNGGDIFKNCLISLSKLKYPEVELIVVDNGSKDDSEKLIANYFSNFKLIQNKTNLGFAPANNQGYKEAHGKYILLLNNDTKITASFLDVLVGKMEKDPTLGVVQPKILIMDKPKYLDNVGSFLTKTGFLQHVGYMEKDSERYNKERIIFSAKGACMLIRKSIVDRAGLFDESFISYFEETDFCFKVYLMGYKVLFVAKVHIFHKVGFSSKKQNQITVNYHSIKNRIASLIKNLERKNLLLIGGLHLFLITGLGFYYLVNLQIKKSGMIWKALGWNLINMPVLIKKRHQIQHLRVKSDSEIFKFIMNDFSWKEMFAHFKKVEANF